MVMRAGAQVLEEMRPYLLADGGNVAVSEIEGPNVYLQLQGACGTCPSSAMTMKMGLERGLKEKIPEILDVIQVPSEVSQRSPAHARSRRPIPPRPARAPPRPHALAGASAWRLLRRAARC
jgi:Fe-S cluster biogenesis protein NfuA